MLVASYPTSFSIIALNQVSTKPVAGHYPRESLRRIAAVDMAPVVGRLWVQYNQHEEPRHLLLLIIELGHLKECTELAREAAWSRYSDPHTRVIAGRALLAVADPALLDQHVKMIMAQAKTLPGFMLWDVLEKCFPGRMSIADVLSIFQTMSVEQRDESYGMQIHGQKLVKSVTRQSDLEQLLACMLELIGDRPDPYNYDETAAEAAYGPAIEEACHRLLMTVGPNDAPEVALDAALRLGADDRYRRKQNSKQIVDALHSSASRRRLFLWRAAKKLSGHPHIQGREVSNLLQVETLGWPVGLKKEDLEWLLTDFPTRPTEAMRSLAVDAAIRLWKEHGMSSSELERIRAAVSSSPKALEFIDAFLAPPVVSEETIRLNLEHKAVMEEHALRRAEQDQSWIDFIENMKANPVQLLTAAAPTADTVDDRLHSLWQLINADAEARNRCSVDNIDFLEPYLGVELVRTLKAALKAFWRMRKPALDSERDGNQRKLIKSFDCMGLVGVSLEARDDSQWVSRLTSAEAILATQYATIEINGFPVWLSDLSKAWPSEVGDVLMGEALVELSDNTSKQYHGILDDLAQGPAEIGTVLASRFLEHLQGHPELSDRRLSLLLDVLLRGIVSENARTALIELALTRFYDSSDREHQALYLGAAFRLDAAVATAALTEKLDRLDDAGQRELGQLLLPRIFGKHGPIRDRGLPDVPFDVLERLVRVAYQTVRPEEDNDRPSGVVYSSDSRDYAETARSAAFNQLFSTPGYATYAALKRLATTPGFPIDPSHLQSLASQRAELDSDRAPWPPQEAYDLEQKFDLAPRTPADLRSLAISRIDEIQHDLHNADFAQGPTVKLLPDERAVQNWVGTELRTRKGRAYSLEREPHVVNENEPDIRLMSLSTDARLPIEIKVAESWSRRQLEEALTGQLCGKYMRERGDSHGVLLLVHQDSRMEGWESDTGKMLNFEQLVAYLRGFADRLASTAHDSPQVAIAVIDVSDVVVRSRK